MLEARRLDSMSTRILCLLTYHLQQHSIFQVCYCFVHLKWPLNDEIVKELSPSRTVADELEVRSSSSPELKSTENLLQQASVASITRIIDTITVDSAEIQHLFNM